MQFTVACAEGCASDAIVFGDLNDKNSEVVKLQQKDIAFMSLGELNVLPSISYVSRIRNQDEPLIIEKDASSKDAH